MFRNMNAALRQHDYAALQPYLPFMNLLLTALYKLPLVEAEVYRGVKADLAKVSEAIPVKLLSSISVTFGNVDWHV